MSEGSAEKPTHSTFNIVAALCVVAAVFTPLMLISLPLLGAMICAVLGFVRKERLRWLAPFTIVLCISLLIASARQMAITA